MSVTFYLLHIEDSGAGIDSQWQIFGGEPQREEMREGCDLPCSNPFILSFNLIGVAQLAYTDHQLVAMTIKIFHVVVL